MSMREFDKPSIEKQDKIYRVVITDVKEDKELMNEELTSIGLVGEGKGDHTMTEVMLNMNVMTLAALFSAGSKTCHAARLASLVQRMKDEEEQDTATAVEESLLGILSGRIEGGIQ